MAVLDEIAAGQTDSETLLDHTIFYPLEVANKIAVAGLLGRLHIGEAQVMIGAIEKDIATVILDDSTARNKAKQLGLHVTGTLSILLKAHQLGIIEDLAQEITKLRSAGMHLSDSVVKMLLAHK